jgi:hypothetical protein
MRASFRMFALVSLACLLTFALPASADTIDQQSGFTAGFSGLSLGGGGFLAQTFTAGVNATLTGVSIASFGFGGPFTLSIYDTQASGAPGTTLLASTTVGASNSFGVQITFPVGFAQSAGTTYAIVLQVAGAASPAWVLAGSGDQYSGGQGYFSVDGVNWSPLTSASSAGDFTFQTYVNPVPEPGTLALLGSGVAGIWLRRRRKA